MSDHQADYDDGDRPPRPRHNGRLGGGFGGGGGGGGGAGGGGGGGFPGPSVPHADLPLRILVNSEMVGAIIGRQGNTIRQITQNTRARVDVHRKDSNGATEKAITIYGNPDNCDNACREILEVMTQEAASTNKGEVPLKILAHNNLIGRIIGKGGNVIKGIMEETDTRITVSRATDVNSFNLDRTITIKGCPEGISEAERMVMARLRQSYENDMHSAPAHAPLYADVGRMMAGAGYGRGEPGLYGAGPAGYGGLYPAAAGLPGPHGQPETVFVYVPSAAVGAIIGRKGSHIRSMIRFSSASVKISQQEEEPLGAGRADDGGSGGGGGGSGGGGGGGGNDSGDGGGGERGREGDDDGGQDGKGDAGEDGDGDGHGDRRGDASGDAGGEGDAGGDGGREGGAAERPESAEQPPPLAERAAERKVAIYGTPEAQWKAQYMIFDKLREEGYGSGQDDVRLSVEISVPSSQVGRIIGKKGQNVRELQRATGTVIKLPQPPADGQAPAETTVHIVGSFISVQSAQRRIRALVAQGAPPPARPPRGADSPLV